MNYFGVIVSEGCISMENRISFVTKSVQKTEKVGFNLAKSLKDGGFVAFFGDLGAGKTAFVRGMGQAICPECDVSSPTFAIINEYKVGRKTVLCHVDAYRIKDDDDLYSTGFYDCAEYPGCIMAVEWSENIPFALPDDAVRVTIEKLGDTERKITVENAPNEFSLNINKEDK